MLSISAHINRHAQKEASGQVAGAVELLGGVARESHEGASAFDTLRGRRALSLSLLLGSSHRERRAACCQQQQPGGPLRIVQSSPPSKKPFSCCFFSSRLFLFARSASSRYFLFLSSLVNLLSP